MKRILQASQHILLQQEKTVNQRSIERPRQDWFQPPS